MRVKNCDGLQIVPSNTSHQLLVVVAGPASKGRFNIINVKYLMYDVRVALHIYGQLRLGTDRLLVRTTELPQPFYCGNCLELLGYFYFISQS